MSDSVAHSGDLTFKDLAEAVAKLKRVDPVTLIKTGSLLPIERIAPIKAPVHLRTFYGIDVVLDEDMPVNEYKIIHASGKEERHRWI